MKTSRRGFLRAAPAIVLGGAAAIVGLAATTSQRAAPPATYGQFIYGVPPGGRALEPLRYITATEVLQRQVEFHKELAVRIAKAFAVPAHML